MNFIPDSEQPEYEVPFLDEAKSKDGWQGHATNESIAALRAQISAEIGRLGGSVTRWMPGTFDINGKKRPGIQIEYQIVGPTDNLFSGRIDVAGLPWKLPYGGKTYHSGYKKSVENQKHKSLSMALYNVREALKAMRILQILSPGYAALVPWMLVAETGKTIGEMWNIGSYALPAPDNEGEIIHSTFVEVEE